MNIWLFSGIIYTDAHMNAPILKLAVQLPWIIKLTAHRLEMLLNLDKSYKLRNSHMLYN
jgi:hypothetical protein